MFNVPAEKPNAFAGAADLSEVDLSAPNLKLMIATRGESVRCLYIQYIT
jgi:hypothetical protein